MLTRRDQVQAYRFAQARVQSAVLGANPDRRDVPLRRQRVAVVAGVAAGVVLAIGFGMYGLVRPGGKQGWRAERSIVLEKETGARYVYDKGDGLLHPVVNYASARLILGDDSVQVRQFSRASLTRAPRGAARGIVGLPDAVPDPSRFVSGPWVVCSAGGRTTLTVGSPVDGERLARDRAVLVQVPQGQKYLVWNDTRLLVADESALIALNLDPTAVVPVSSTWLNAVTAGPDLGLPPLGGIGRPVRYKVADKPALIGQIHKTVVPGAGATYYVTLPDGLARIPETTALLMLADPRLKPAYRNRTPYAFTRNAGEVSPVLSHTRIDTSGVPDTVPKVVPIDRTAADGAGLAVCSAYADTTGRTTQAEVFVRAPGSGSSGSSGGSASAQFAGDATSRAGDATSRAGDATSRAGDATQVVLPAGRAALVRLLPQPDQAAPSVFLVTDSGAKFPVTSEKAQAALGLRDVVAVPLPTGLAGLVPTGPALDPDTVNRDLPPQARWQLGPSN